MLSLQAQRLRLTIDGTPHVERAVMCVVANSFRLGMGLPVAPRAKLTDDDLDVVIVGDLRRGELIPYYRAFRAQTHLGLPKIATARAREVSIDSSHRLNIHCDDQIVGSTPATITSHPAALKVRVEGSTLNSQPSTFIQARTR